MAKYFKILWCAVCSLCILRLSRLLVSQKSTENEHWDTLKIEKKYCQYYRGIADILSISKNLILTHHWFILFWQCLDIWNPTAKTLLLPGTHYPTAKYCG